MNAKVSLILWIILGLFMAYRLGGLQARVEFFHAAQAQGVSSAFTDLHLSQMRTEARDWRICSVILTLCLACSVHETWTTFRRRRSARALLD